MIIKEGSNNKSNDYEPIPKGTHNAICVTVAGIGKQETSYGEKEQVILTFEIPSIVREWTKDGEPQKGRAQISRTFTCSLAPKASLRILLENWRDKEFTAEELGGFDLKKILGVPCCLRIKHKVSVDGTRTYANIVDIDPFDGEEELESEAELIHYDPFNHNKECFDLLPNWIQDKVEMVTKEGLEDDLKKAVIEDLEGEEIPF
tara:strand:- start:82 stop:693 length:612 start_codon:yes stop_codon:yes gene_type:complete